MHSTSIRTKLTIYFLSIGAVMLAADAIFAFFHFSITNAYESIASNISRQYELIERTEELVADYNAYRNAPGERTLRAYEDGKAEISTVFVHLENTITDPDSYATFLGVRNTILSVLNETDNGVRGIAAGSIENTSKHYVEANKKLYYVKENTADLILKEVERSITLQAEASRMSHNLLIVSSIILTLVLIAAFTISNVWTQKLVSPLSRLTTLARNIADGDLEIGADADLLERKDEFGSLSQSLDTMIHNLRESVHSLQKTNAEMAEAKKSVDAKNADLEHFNKLMTNRELRMVELKKRIAELEKELGSNVEAH